MYTSIHGDTYILIEYSNTLQNNIINLFRWNRSQYWKVGHFTHFNYFLATLVVAYPVLHPDLCLQVERVRYHAICSSISFTFYECILHSRYFLEAIFLQNHDHSSMKIFHKLNIDKLKRWMHANLGLYETGKLQASTNQCASLRR